MDRTRIGLIGAGAIAQSYARALLDSKVARVAGVADVRVEAARAVAETLACPSFASYEDLVRETQCEAVIVCTPPATHPSICVDVAQRGIHILCEKPLAISSGEASRMLTAASEAGVILTMASKFRFVEDVVRAKALIASGTLGDVLLFENCFTSQVDMISRWNSDPTVSGGGVLIDNGTHSVDIMRYLFGPLAELQVVEGKRHQGLKVEDTVRIFVRTLAGVMGSIDLSWSINKELPNYISIYGSGGTLHVGWKESKYKRRADEEWTRFGDGYDKIQAFRAQIDNFAKSIQGEEAPRVSPEEALGSVEVVETAYVALESSDWQHIQGHGPHAVPLAPALRPAPGVHVHPTAIVEKGVSIGAGSAIWSHVHVRHDTVIGDECILGGNTIVAYGVNIGNRVKVNSFVYICNGVTLEDGVMVSAQTVFTNDRFPRATTPDLAELRGSDPDESTRPTLVREGATIGAACTIGCDLTIGRFAMIGMGSVVTHTVPDFHLAVGNPARSVGCVCRCGELLARFSEESEVRRDVSCPSCARVYVIEGETVREVAGADDRTPVESREAR